MDDEKTGRNTKTENAPSSMDTAELIHMNLGSAFVKATKPTPLLLENSCASSVGVCAVGYCCCVSDVFSVGASTHVLARLQSIKLLSSLSGELVQSFKRVPA
jgi:hypothetical protein